jgi:hypothetical protein
MTSKALLTPQEAIQLVGKRAYSDWLSRPSFDKLEIQVAGFDVEFEAKRLPRRPVFLTAGAPVFASQPDAMREEYDRARAQYEAVSEWLFAHGFAPTQLHERVELEKALAGDPLKVPFDLRAILTPLATRTPQPSQKEAFDEAKEIAQGHGVILTRQKFLLGWKSFDLSTKRGPRGPRNNRAKLTA